jgi:hypothetical protein
MIVRLWDALLRFSYGEIVIRWHFLTEKMKEKKRTGKTKEEQRFCIFSSREEMLHQWSSMVSMMDAMDKESWEQMRSKVCTGEEIGRIVVAQGNEDWL